jgi:nicotinamidase-related amidase
MTCRLPAARRPKRVLQRVSAMSEFGKRLASMERDGLHIPARAALLLVDVQKGFVTEETREVPERIVRFLDAHQQRFEVVVASRYVNAPDSACRRLLAYGGVSAPPETDLCDGIERDGVRVLEKTTYALGAPLGSLLAEHAVKRLFMAGMDTHACVLHEALDAFDRCIRPVVLHELCASGDGVDAHRAALLVLRQSIGIQNVVGLDGRRLEM